MVKADERKCNDWIMKNWKEAQQNQERFYDQIDKWKQQYENVPSTKKQYDGVANVFVPETFKDIQTLKARVLHYIFSGDFFDIKKPAGADGAMIDAYKQFIQRHSYFQGIRKREEDHRQTVGQHDADR